MVGGVGRRRRPRRRTPPPRRTTAPRTRSRCPAGGSASRAGRSGGRTRRTCSDQPCRRPYPGAAQYETCQRQRPSGGAIGAAAARSPARRIARMSPAWIWRVAGGDDGADDAAHHLVAERGGLDLEAQHAVAEVGPAGPAHPPHERHRLLAGRGLGPPAERAEVVLAEERVARQREQLDVERRRHVPRRGGEERIGHRPVEHGVAVGAAGGREAGVEVRRRPTPTSRTTIAGPHSFTQRALRAPSRSTLGRQVERHDLAPRVHARGRCARRT